MAEPRSDGMQPVFLVPKYNLGTGPKRPARRKLVGPEKKNVL
jgi:hypothetical protein